jgi:hypothetical protein
VKACLVLELPCDQICRTLIDLDADARTRKAGSDAKCSIELIHNMRLVMCEVGHFSSRASLPSMHVSEDTDVLYIAGRW